MKIPELRKELEKYTKQDLIKLAAEFYKLIPKAKKEGTNVDDLVVNYKKAKAAKETAVKSKDLLTPLSTLQKDISLFIENAKEQLYLYPNKIISKKERPLWRFKVKAWFKELTDLKRPDRNWKIQAALLHELCLLLQEGEHSYTYFSTQEPFRSVGIEEKVFLHATLYFKKQAVDPKTYIHETTTLMLATYVYSELREVFFEFLDTDDLLELAAKEMLQIRMDFFTLDEVERLKKKSDYKLSSKIRKHNDLVELIFYVYARLDDIQKGIKMLWSYYIEDRSEITLYVLSRNLISLGEHQLIVQEIEAAQAKGIKPRDALLTLHHKIKNEGETPRHI